MPSPSLPCAVARATLPHEGRRTRRPLLLRIPRNLEAPLYVPRFNVSQTSSQPRSVTLAPAVVGVVLASVALAGCTWMRGATAPVAPAPPRVDTAPIAAQPAVSGLPSHWQRGGFAEIAVRAYQDSDADGVGDLRGLTQRLEYLQALGVRGLVLHGLLPQADADREATVLDHRRVDPVLGTLADFDALVREAHERRLAVLLAYAPHHVAASHPLAIEARRQPKGVLGAWFVGASEPTAGSADGLATLDTRHDPVVAFHQSNLRFWLNRGVDGVRLQLGATSDERARSEAQRLAALLAATVESYPDRWLVCDVTDAAEQFAVADVCGSAFANLPVAGIAKATANPAAALRALAEGLHDARASRPLVAGDREAPRLWDQLDGDAASLRLAAALHVLQPGAPFIRYGDEIGQADAVARGPTPGAAGPTQPRSVAMSWAEALDADRGFTSARGPARLGVAANVATHHVAAQREDMGSLFAVYRDLLDLRQRRPSVARGGIEGLFTRGTVLGFVRVEGDERTLVVGNFGARRVEADVTGLPRRARVAPIYPRRAGASYVAPIVLADGRGTLHLDLPARSVRVFDVEPQRRD